MTDDKFAELQRKLDDALLHQGRFESDMRSKMQIAALAYSTLQIEHRRALERCLAMLVDGRVEEAKSELTVICAQSLASRIEMPSDARQ